jgi:hypothetical protein
MSILRPVAAAALLLFALAVPSQAQPLWFQFSGTTAGQPGDLEFLAGKPFTLTLRLDPTKLDANPGDPVSGIYYGAVTAGRLEVALDAETSIVWTVRFPEQNDNVVVHNRAPGQSDFYGISVAMDGPLNGGHLSLELLDREGTAFESEAFPTALTRFNDFESREIRFFTHTFGLIQSYEIVPGLDLTDTDGDGIPDESDNCRALSNANQSDVDLDLFGDVCDPFPNDSDNEKAQCSIDLSQCSANLAASESQRSACVASLATATNSLTACSANLDTAQAALAAATADADSDRLPNAFDKCPATTAGSAVDSAGCSVEQFCRAIAVNTNEGERTCTALDWLNDEPMMSSKQADCRVDRVQRRCVPTGDR